MQLGQHNLIVVPVHHRTVITTLIFPLNCKLFGRINLVEIAHHNAEAGVPRIVFDDLEDERRERVDEIVIPLDAECDDLPDEFFESVSREENLAALDEIGGHVEAVALVTDLSRLEFLHAFHAVRGKLLRERLLEADGLDENPNRRTSGATVEADASREVDAFLDRSVYLKAFVYRVRQEVDAHLVALSVNTCADHRGLVCPRRRAAGEVDTDRRVDGIFVLGKLVVVLNLPLIHDRFFRKNRLQQEFLSPCTF